MRSSNPPTWTRFTLITICDVSLYYKHPLHHLSLPTADTQFLLQLPRITNHLPCARVCLDLPAFWHLHTSVTVCQYNGAVLSDGARFITILKSHFRQHRYEGLLFWHLSKESSNKLSSRSSKIQTRKWQVPLPLGSMTLRSIMVAGRVPVGWHIPYWGQQGAGENCVIRSFMNCTPLQVLLVWTNKGDEMGRAWGMYGRE